MAKKRQRRHVSQQKEQTKGAKRRWTEPDVLNPNKRHRIAKAYMDDRNLIAGTAEGSLEEISAWQAWSTNVELLGNDSKTKIWARTPGQQRELAEAINAKGAEKWENL